jgi:hypothetical protein
MRVLLDECVSEGLRNYLAGHECQTARYAGFAGLENGQLLTAAEAAKFDVLLTVDRGFEYQQNLGHRKIAVTSKGVGGAAASLLATNPRVDNSCVSRPRVWCRPPSQLFASLAMLS